jgi:transcription initiation factor TFIIF subunit alpha
MLSRIPFIPHYFLFTFANELLAGPSRPQAPPRPGVGPIQPHEIAAALPAEGITIGALMRMFQVRVGDGAQQTDKKEFIRLVKENSSYSADKLLRPLPPK